jgi:hypothetical protein
MSSQLCPGQSLIDRKIDAENFELLTSKLKGQVDQITCPFVVKRQGTGNREKIFIYYPYLPIPFLLSPVTCHLSPVTCHLSPVTCHLPYPKTLAAAAIPVPGVKLS